MTQQTKTILLIDDDRATNFIHKRVIMQAGFTGHVEVCKSVESALDYLTQKGEYQDENYPKPDIIFLDINMPGMDGWDFIEEYKKLDDQIKKGIVVVMLTTSLNPDDDERAANEGIVSRFMLKPLNPSMIDEVIEEYFGGDKTTH